MKTKIWLFLIVLFTINTLNAQINGSIQTQISDWKITTNTQYAEIQIITPPSR